MENFIFCVVALLALDHYSHFSIKLSKHTFSDFKRNVPFQQKVPCEVAFWENQNIFRPNFFSRILSGHCLLILNSMKGKRNNKLNNGRVVVILTLYLPEDVSARSLLENSLVKIETFFCYIFIKLDVSSCDATSMKEISKG